MGQYKVLGSDKTSGEAVAITLTADNKQEARIAAQNKNIRISTIKDFDARNRDTVEPKKQEPKKKLVLDENKRAKKPASAIKTLIRVLILLIIIIVLLAIWRFYF